MYRPPSVAATDSEALWSLLSLHLHNCDPKHRLRVLDCTYSTGQIWEGACPLLFDLDKSDLHPQSLDVRREDYMTIKRKRLDGLVWDPPHIADAGEHSVMGNRFGSVDLTAPGYMETFALQAHAVLRPDGVLIAKMCDGIHSGVYQWHHVNLVNACKRAGFQDFDCIVVPSTSRMPTNRAKRVLHVKNAHVYWIAAMKKKVS